MYYESTPGVGCLSTLWKGRLQLQVEGLLYRGKCKNKKNSHIQCIVEVFDRVNVYCGIVGYSWQSHLLFNTVSNISAKMDYIDV